MENLSIFSKEKSCDLLNKAVRRFFAKPHEAFAHVMPAIVPNDNDISAITIRSMQYPPTTARGLPGTRF